GVEAHRDVLVAGIDDEGLGRRDVHGKSGPDHHRHDSAAKNGGTTNAMFVHRKSLLLMLSDSRAAVPRPDRPFFANRRRLLPGRRNRRTWLISSPWIAGNNMEELKRLFRKSRGIAPEGDAVRIIPVCCPRWMRTGIAGAEGTAQWRWEAPSGRSDSLPAGQRISRTSPGVLPVPSPDR